MSSALLKRRGRPRRATPGPADEQQENDAADIFFIEPSAKDMMIDKTETLLVEWINEQRDMKMKVPALALKTKAKRVFRTLKSQSTDNTVDQFIPDKKWLLTFIKRWGVRYDSAKKTFVTAGEVLKRTKKGHIDSALAINEEDFRDEFDNAMGGGTAHGYDKGMDSDASMNLTVIDEELVDISKIKTQFKQKRSRNMIDVLEQNTPTSRQSSKRSLLTHDGHTIPVETFLDVVQPINVPTFMKELSPKPVAPLDPDFVAPASDVDVSPNGKRFTEKKLRILRRKADELINCVIKYDPEENRRKHVIELIVQASSYYEERRPKRVLFRKQISEEIPAVVPAPVETSQQPSLPPIKIKISGRKRKHSEIIPPPPPDAVPPVKPLPTAKVAPKPAPKSQKIAALRAAKADKLAKLRKQKKPSVVQPKPVKKTKPVKAKKQPAAAVQKKNTKIKIAAKKKQIKNGLFKGLKIKTEPMDCASPVSPEEPLKHDQPMLLLSEVKVEQPDPEDADWHLRLAKEILLTQFDENAAEPGCGEDLPPEDGAAEIPPAEPEESERIVRTEDAEFRQISAEEGKMDSEPHPGGDVLDPGDKLIPQEDELSKIPEPESDIQIPEGGTTTEIQLTGICSEANSVSLKITTEEELTSVPPEETQSMEVGGQLYNTQGQISGETNNNPEINEQDGNIDIPELSNANDLFPEKSIPEDKHSMDEGHEEQGKTSGETINWLNPESNIEDGNTDKSEPSIESSSFSQKPILEETHSMKVEKQMCEEHGKISGEMNNYPEISKQVGNIFISESSVVKCSFSEKSTPEETHSTGYQSQSHDEPGETNNRLNPEISMEGEVEVSKPIIQNALFPEKSIFEETHSTEDEGYLYEAQGSAETNNNPEINKKAGNVDIPELGIENSPFSPKPSPEKTHSTNDEGQLLEKQENSSGETRNWLNPETKIEDGTVGIPEPSIESSSFSQKPIPEETHSMEVEKQMSEEHGQIHGEMNNSPETSKQDGNIGISESSFEKSSFSEKSTPQETHSTEYQSQKSYDEPGQIPGETINRLNPEIGVENEKMDSSELSIENTTFSPVQESVVPEERLHNPFTSEINKESIAQTKSEEIITRIPQEIPESSVISQEEWQTNNLRPMEPEAVVPQEPASLNHHTNHSILLATDPESRVHSTEKKRVRFAEPECVEDSSSDDDFSDSEEISSRLSEQLPTGARGDNVNYCHSTEPDPGRSDHHVTWTNETNSHQIPLLEEAPLQVPSHHPLPEQQP